MKSPYYLAYEDRYRRVYAQGVEYWTADPEEIRETTATLDAFLAAIPTADPLILECGCGEGHLALHLAARGFRYVGVDIAPSAIEKARRRLGAADLHIPPTFHVMDSTRLEAIADAAFDVVIDNFLLHMLVTDPDRTRYFAEVRRVLRPGGRAYFHENFQPGAERVFIASFEEYLQGMHPDLTTEELREAWQGGTVVRIRLPRLPARANSRDGYIGEFESAGFTVRSFESGGSTCVLHVEKPSVE